MMRFGSLIAAVTLMFIATYFWRKSRQQKTSMQWTAAIFGLLAGCALVGTFIGDWMADAPAWLGLVFGGVLLVAGGIAVADVLSDKKPDTWAFRCTFVLPLLLVFGIAQVPNIWNSVTDGAGQVGTQVEQFDGSANENGQGGR